MSKLPTTRYGLFDDLFRDMAPGFFVRPLHGDGLPQQIKVDVKEDPEAFTLHADLPGVAKDDIHVTIDGPLVTLSAEIKQQDSQARNERVLRSERYYGSVSRSFQLPIEVDEARAVAKYDNGVLELKLPKKAAQGGARRLQIG